MRALYLLFGIYMFFDRRRRFAVTGFIFFGNELLLVRHSYGNPNWLPVGGFIKVEEGAEEGLRREVREEVGLELERVASIGQAHDKRRNITIFRFYAQARSRECIIDELEIVEAKWFSIEEADRLCGKNDPFFYKAINHHKQNVGY